MKLNKILIALGFAGAFAGAFAGLANAAPVSKSITLTAQINDAIFVSKPDGSSWYGTEELEAKDHTQKEFTKTLPIRVWTSSASFRISLAQPLRLSSGPYQMLDPSVFLTHAGGDVIVPFGSTATINQTAADGGGFDEVHNLKISVKSPSPTAKGPSTNGSYSGELVMLFEPLP